MTGSGMRSIAVAAALAETHHAPTFTVVAVRDELGPHLDPWLGLDLFRMSAPYFPPHLHAGFAAVTYVFDDSPAGFVSRDTLGVHAVIPPGGLHWFEAGAGAVHHEVPERTGVATHGLQMFVNLAAAHELAPPAVFDVAPADTPVVERAGARVRVLAGAALGARSPLTAPRTPVMLLDVALRPGAEVVLPAPSAHHAWALGVAGDGEAGPTGRASPLGVRRAAAFAPDGDALALRAGPGGLHVVVGAGAPLREPVHWGGPVAMSSPARVADTLARHARGEFGRL